MVNHDKISRRAFEISQANPDRLPDQNWYEAERLLKRKWWETRLLSTWRWSGISKRDGLDLIEFLAKLSIPLVILYGGWWLNSSSQDQQNIIAHGQSQDAILREYFKEIKPLIVSIKSLRGEDNGRRELIAIAQAYTESTLAQLDDWSIGTNVSVKNRKRILLKFLLQSNLLSPKEGILSLSGTDLSGADLSYLDLSGMDLRGIDFGNVLYAYGIKLRNAKLSGIVLNTAYMVCADLQGADLRGMRLGRLGNDLNLANLKESKLQGLDLSKTRLTQANLDDANLQGANLRGLDLSTATLKGANLANAKWNKKTRWPMTMSIKRDTCQSSNRS
jgi:hypothetical protein